MFFGNARYDYRRVVVLANSYPVSGFELGKDGIRPRSEEHTSELQSPLIISYAVRAQLETQYRVRMCEHDHTAIVVSGMTEKQLSDLCRRLHCSGMYNDTGRFGICLLYTSDMG